MGIVKEKIVDANNRPAVIEDCAALVDSEVAAKKGMSGIMIKTGYKTFKAIKPTIVKDAVDVLLDRFAEKLDIQYENYLAAVPDKGQSFDKWASLRDKEIADDLLGVTDDIVNRSNKQAVKKIYNSLRKIAQANVAQAVPAVGKLVMKYVD